MSSSLISIDVYIPFLPCACAPGKTDAKATAFNELLLEFKQSHKDRLAIGIYALNQHLSRFRENPLLASLLQTQGKEGLPLICINGAPVFTGMYPDRAALEAALEPLLRA